jgi:hypothetical protein
MTILAIISAIGAAISAFFFRKGGIYNRIEPIDIPEAPILPIQPVTLPSEPIIPIPAKETPMKPTVKDFCNAIAEFEGAPGDANHINNNPGNCRFNYTGYMPMYGVVKCSPKGFAIFKDWDTGMLYLNNMVKGMIHNHPTETILQFMTRYAPSFENPTVAYANFITKKLGVDNSYMMKDLV